MRCPLHTCLAGIVAVLLAAPALAQTSKDPNERPANPVQPTETQDVTIGQLRVMGRIHVGESAPDFTATSTSGRELTLSRLKGDWLVLVFAENREDFAAFRDVHDEFLRAGALVYGLCKDKPQRLRAIAERDKLPFDLIADDTGDISAVYGLYDRNRRSTLPGFALVDRQGIVRLALQGQAPPHEIAELTRFAVSSH